MNWTRVCAVLAALGIHAGTGAGLVYFGSDLQDPSALQSGNGRDDLSIVATVTLETEESIGLDPITAEHQDASAAAPPVPETKEEEVKKEEAIEMMPPPPEASAPPQAPIREKPPEKEAEKEEVVPVTPALPAAPQEEQHAMNRELEARRSQLESLYKTEIYRAITTHTLRPKKVLEGSVWVELTLSPTGKLISHRVVKSSGFELLDKTAMANLERVPFPPPPDGFPKEPYRVTFPFDYSVK